MRLLRIQRRRDRDMISNGGVAIAFKQSGDVNGVACEPRLRRALRNRRQDERREKPDDRKRADGFDKGKSGLFAHRSSYRDALLIMRCEFAAFAVGGGLPRRGRRLDRDE